MLTYNGVELSLNTPEITQWLESDAAILSGRSLERVLLDYPGPAHDSWAWIRTEGMPAPRIGTLYWPNGASRWSVGYFLATTTQLDAIEATSEYNPAEPHEFKMGFPLDDAPEDPADDINLITTDLYLLAPIPLAYTDGAATLYLLVFVDSRFFWRWKEIDIEELNSPFELPVNGGNPVTWTYWHELVSLLVEAVEPNETNEPVTSEGYLAADMTQIMAKSETNDRFRPASEMLDMVVANINSRVMRLYNGGIKIRNWVAGDSDHQVNQTKGFHRTKGADIGFLALEDDYLTPTLYVDLMRPKSVKFTFPRRHAVYGLPLNGWYEKTIIYTSGVNGTVMTIPSTAWALIEDGDNGLMAGEPTNKQQLDDFALVFAEDMIQKFNHILDITYASICQIRPNPFADRIIFTYRHDECSTRVLSEPWNNLPERSTHQIPDAPDEMAKIQFAMLDEEASPLATADATALEISPAVTLKVTDRLGGLPTGTKILVLWDTATDPPRWLIIAGACE